MMPPESWLVVTLAVGSTLLGIVGCALAGVVARRCLHSVRVIDQGSRKLADQLVGLERRLVELESNQPSGMAHRGHGKHRAISARVTERAGAPSEPKLIAVPSLESSPGDRDGTASGLKERHAAIWALADTGAKPDVIARATGQPIGQIELILGLRRQIDGTRANLPQGFHA